MLRAEVIFNNGVIGVVKLEATGSKKYIEAADVVRFLEQIEAANTKPKKIADAPQTIQEQDVPYDEFVRAYNEIAGAVFLKCVGDLPAYRKQAIKGAWYRYGKDRGIEWWRALWRYVLTTNINTPKYHNLNIDWFLRPQNLTRFVEQMESKTSAKGVVTAVNKQFETAAKEWVEGGSDGKQD